MDKIDFAIGWPEDGDVEDLFTETLAGECRARRMKFLVVHEKNLKRCSQDIMRDRLRISFFLDMASETFDANHPFTKFVYLVKDTGGRIVDDPDRVKAAADKSITHFNLISSKVPVPATVVIRHWEPSRQLTSEEEARLGSPFVIKPALGYGQKGVKVIEKKRPLREIAEARQYSPGDNFLLQEFVKPLSINGRPAWFRVYQLFGEVIPCWWNPETHVYSHVTLREMDDLKLLPLVRIASEIGRIARVDWFSSEIAINSKNRKFVAIDYMNDQCAIYPKSEHADGVPDDLIVLIAQRLTEKAWRYKRGEFTLSYRAAWFPKAKVVDEDA
jgi:hypothetical protein